MCHADKNIDRKDGFMIKYEKMSREHMDGLIEVEEQCFNSGFARQTFEKEFENKIAIYVSALEGEMIVGYAGLWNICGEADIMHIGVRKDFRRRGIAYGMLGWLIEMCREQKVFAINLEVRKSNEAARALYRKLGFEEIGMRKNYYDGTEDAVLMKLDLEKDDKENEDTCN